MARGNSGGAPSSAACIVPLAIVVIIKAICLLSVDARLWQENVQPNALISYSKCCNFRLRCQLCAQKARSGKAVIILIVGPIDKKRRESRSAEAEHARTMRPAQRALARSKASDPESRCGGTGDSARESLAVVCMRESCRLELPSDFDGRYHRRPAVPPEAK